MNNPYINAILAALYIGLVVSIMTALGTVNGGVDSYLTPVIALGLLVLSVATMGFLFFYRPLILILDSKRDEAVGFFFRTLGTFAVLILLVTAASLVLFG